MWRIILAMVVVVALIDNRNSAPSPATSTEPSEPAGPSASEIRANVKLSDISFRLAELNSLLFSGTVENANDLPVGDVFIRCTTYGQTNAWLDRLDFTLRRVLAPGESVELADINMGIADPQTSRVLCRVVNVNQ